MTDTLTPTRDDFAALLDETLKGRDLGEGQVVHGRVVGIEKDIIIIDVGLKTEGRISAREFGQGEGASIPKVGDDVEVYLERVENALGEAVISRDKARREEAWTRLEAVFAEEQPVMGAIVGRVKGGFTVDLGGASAFLPGSQVDIRPVRDVGPLMGKEQPFAILKMDRPRGNIVVSRRAILEEARAEQRTELVGQLAEGEVREGVVKNITDYGAFVDLGGIDGLLHVTDMSWKRVSHPSQVLAVGDTVQVQIVKINPDTQRISLGMKQLQADPWDGVEAKYPVGAKMTGRITNITDYGAFVELEAGVEGLVHVSEMSWTKKNVHPGKIVSTSQEVDVVVLDVDSAKRRISLGLKQAQDNPWDAFVANHPIGSTVEGEVKNATEFGLFIGLDSDIDGMVHLSDLDWNVSGEEAIQRYRKGEMVKAKVLDVDVEKERVSLGIKQLGGDPMEGDTYKKGQQITVTVSSIETGGIEVKFGEDDAPVTAFVRKSDLSRDRAEQRPERFAVGDRIDAMITGIEKATRRVSVSVKALEMKDEQEAIEQFGSSDSGASLGDILGAALREKGTTKD
ncbi:MULTISPECIES: 30S ribosomal protein S1 [Brevundimonas]|jgi:small subunit ribosomal protein S1|uniref:30S ribosomal protein S1 n=2 Tax=Brevundimonas TaxID=41275 RepID=A0A7W9E7U5_9CAUL|nr:MULTISPECIES: 30S ribosomal protein S1 [Brevundimonas]MAL88195.1 30S ribosomal protein S1 [Brevundimonas sp.]MBB5661341.1 small subunit ribosomal protein S1 [Brevundimonas halotolerans]HAJ04216.1 30S ribosomal protein S1 [Brevundimonas sp.]HAV50667.1 30S ribosomal protein S1 [Brevundimonas sp.]|tara:strand:- start:10832 stop:12535 length:1704 start_codon:yes stop_codon:yes gene_type:complete